MLSCKPNSLQPDQICDCIQNIDTNYSIDVIDKLIINCTEKAVSIIMETNTKFNSDTVFLQITKHLKHKCPIYKKYMPKLKNYYNTLKERTPTTITNEKDCLAFKQGTFYSLLGMDTIFYKNHNGYQEVIYPSFNYYAIRKIEFISPCSYSVQEKISARKDSMINKIQAFQIIDIKNDLYTIQSIDSITPFYKYNLIKY